jgi:hypothetical protein
MNEVAFDGARQLSHSLHSCRVALERGTQSYPRVLEDVRARNTDRFKPNAD